MGAMWDRGVGRWVRIYIPLGVLLLVMLFPFYWMAITSFKSTAELFDLDRSPLFVSRPTLAWYEHLFTQSLYPRWMLNSTVVAVASTAISPCRASSRPDYSPSPARGTKSSTR